MFYYMLKIWIILYLISYSTNKGIVLRNFLFNFDQTSVEIQSHTVMSPDCHSHSYTSADVISGNVLD